MKQKTEVFIVNRAAQKKGHLIILLILISVCILQQLLMHQKLADNKQVAYRFVTGEASDYCWQNSPYGGFQVPDCEQVQAGSILEVIGSPSSPDDSSIKSIKKLELSSISYHSLTLTSPIDCWLFLRSQAVKLKVKAVGAIRIFLEEPSASMVEALLFGGSRNLTQTTRHFFEVTGILHIVAASGWHLAIVTGFVQHAVRIFSKRWVGFLLTITATLYLSMAFSDSLLRASTYFVFLIVGRYFFQRQTRGVILLLWSGFVLLLLQPLLLYSVGFQLSVLATMGILLWTELSGNQEQTLPEQLLPTSSTRGRSWAKLFLEYARGASQISLAAQLAVFPLLLATFGVVSLLSIPTTLLIVWALPTVFLLSVLLTLLGLLAQGAAPLLALMLLPLTQGVLIVVEQFAGFTEFQLHFSLSQLVASVWAVMVLGLGLCVVLRRGSRYERLRV